MIWIDILEPKYSMFFIELIPLLEKRGYSYIVTTRHNESYKESSELLTLHGIKHHNIGGYGDTLEEKFTIRMQRQQGFLDLFKQIGYPKVLLCGASVDAIQCASAIGIKSVNFADTPLRNHVFNYNDITVVSKLTFPLSDLLFHPFVVPAEVYNKIGVDNKKIISYDFIDVCLWMKNIKQKSENDFRRKYKLDSSKYTILCREEEFKANYVNEKLPVIYELIEKILDTMDVNIVIMPRYESSHLYARFSDRVTVLEEKLKPEEFYPFIDMLIGGGGTMNLEAGYMGIPVISTRSFLLFHDKYLIDNKIIKWSNCSDEALGFVQELIGKKYSNKSFFCKSECSFEKIFNMIEERFL